MDRPGTTGDDHAAARRALPRHEHEEHLRPPEAAAGRRTKGAVPRRRLAAGKAPPAAIVERIARFAPDAPDAWGADEMHVLVKNAARRPHAFMCHGTRWLPGAKIAAAKKTANIRRWRRMRRSRPARCPRSRSGMPAPT